MENHYASPHSYTDCVVSEGQAVRANEKSSRSREQPDGAHAEDIDYIAKVGQEKVKATFVERVVPNREEVEKLPSIPIMEILRVPSNNISTDKDVEDPTNKEYFIPKSNRLRRIPTSAKSLDIVVYILTDSCHQSCAMVYFHHQHLLRPDPIEEWPA